MASANSFIPIMRKCARPPNLLGSRLNERRYRKVPVTVTATFLVRPHAFLTPSRAVTRRPLPRSKPISRCLTAAAFDRGVLDPYDRRPLALIGRIRVRKDRCQTQLVF